MPVVANEQDDDLTVYLDPDLLIKMESAADNHAETQKLARRAPNSREAALIAWAGELGEREGREA